jgi:hemoglobin
MNEKAGYGKDVFNMLGGIEGLRALANCFYDIMHELPEAKKIRHMHPENLGPTRENLTLFLCGWLGGPPLYKEKYGPIDLTNHHAHLKINIAERDMWLTCMEQALDKQAIDDDLKAYLLKRFRVPAEKICAWCQQQILQSIDSAAHKLI